MSNNFISPTGYVDLDDDCEYSIDLKSTRSRESINPKEDLAFYFNTYITPKYGLENINVNNVASFMKDLERNWTKLSPELKDKVLNIMVDGILNNPNGNFDFKNSLLSKLKIDTIPQPPKSTFVNQKNTFENPRRTFENTKSNFVSKSNFGSSSSNKIFLYCFFILFIVGVCFIFKPRQAPYSRMS